MTLVRQADVRRRLRHGLRLAAPAQRHAASRLKVNCGSVTSLGVAKADSSIVRAVRAPSCSMGLEVITESVETSARVELLQ